MLQIKNENVKKSSSSFEGSTLEIFNIGKDEYFNYFPEKNQYKKDINLFGITIILECDEKNVKEVIDNFNKYKDEIKKLLDLNKEKESELNIRNKKDKIYIDLIALKKDNKEENSDENKNEEVKNKDVLFDEVIKEDDYIAYFPLIANGLKAKLTTKVNFVNLFEENDEEQIDKMIFNTKLDFEGETIKSKIFMSFLILLFNGLKTRSLGKKFYYLFNDIFLSVINGDFSYTILNQDMFDDYKEDKKELLNFLRGMGYESVKLFKDPKFKVFQKVNFNKIKVGIFGSPLFKVGYVGVKFESSKNNEFIDKILNDTINEETFKKFTE